MFILLLFTMAFALTSHTLPRVDVKMDASRLYTQIIRNFVKDDYVSFYMGLKPNISGVKYIKDYILNETSNIHSPNYGKFWSKSKIIEMLTPSKKTIESVYQWLHNNNASTIINSGDVFFSSMKTLQFMKSFKVADRNRYTSQEFPPKINSIYEIPEELKDIVTIMEIQMGNNLDRKIKRLRGRVLKQKQWREEWETFSLQKGYISREVLLKTYNINGGFVSNNVSIAAIEFNGSNGFNQYDMMKTQNASSVKENPVSPNHLLGVNTFPPDDESELDMSVIWMSAADAELWYVDYPGWIFGWANYMFERDDIPQVVSLSWGWSETDQCSITLCPKNVTSQDYVEFTNIALMKLVARGVTIVVSSGDAGSPGRTNELCDKYHTYMNPIFPGGSPWVLSVGASYLSDMNWTTPICRDLPCPSILIESMTSYNQTRWTSGAGFTHWDETPIWQTKAVKKYLESNITFPDKKYFNNKGRAYPDITAYGHNCAMYDGHQGWVGMDGTSCSAPIIAGMIAYINHHQISKGKPTVGFVNPLFYEIYERNPTSFNDISIGNSACTEQLCCDDQNFGFLPVKGIWDVVSGLGSPNVANILQELDHL
jgi:subtilase family serine protease